MATCAPSEEFTPYHHREVVILHDVSSQDPWLDPMTSPADALALLRPSPPGSLLFRPVGNAVNVPGQNGPDCIEEGSIQAPVKPLRIRRPEKEQPDLF